MLSRSTFVSVRDYLACTQSDRVAIGGLNTHSRLGRCRCRSFCRWPLQRKVCVVCKVQRCFLACVALTRAASLCGVAQVANTMASLMDLDAFKALIDFTDDAMCLFDSDSLTLSFCSAAAARLLEGGKLSVQPSKTTLQELMEALLSSQSKTLMDDLVSRCQGGEVWTYEPRLGRYGSTTPTVTAKRLETDTFSGFMIKLRSIAANVTTKTGVLHYEDCLCTPWR